MLNSIEERVSRVSKINKRGTRIDPGTIGCYKAKDALYI